MRILHELPFKTDSLKTLAYFEYINSWCFCTLEDQHPEPLKDLISDELKCIEVHSHMIVNVHKQPDQYFKHYFRISHS